MRTAVMVLCALLGSASPAVGALAPNEAVSVLNVRQASRNVSEGVRGYVSVLMSNYTNAATRQTIGLGATLALNAQREINLALGLLLNVITEQEGTPLFGALAAESRAARVELAWWRVDRALSMLDSAQDTLSSLKGSFPADTIFQDAIYRANDIWFAYAITSLQQVDRSLAYADPNPPSFPLVVGPRGDFETAEWNYWRSQHYAHDAMDFIVAAYGGEELPDYRASSDVIGRLLSAVDFTVDSMTLLANATWTAQQQSAGLSSRVLEILRWTTDARFLPGRWMQAIEGLTTGWLPAMANRPIVTSYVSAALVKVVDSWKHADNAAWRLMVIPACPPLAPEGCGGL